MCLGNVFRSTSTSSALANCIFLGGLSLSVELCGVLSLVCAAGLVEAQVQEQHAGYFSLLPWYWCTLKTVLR